MSVGAERLTEMIELPGHPWFVGVSVPSGVHLDAAIRTSALQGLHRGGHPPRVRRRRKRPRCPGDRGSRLSHGDESLRLRSRHRPPVLPDRGAVRHRVARTRDGDRRAPRGDDRGRSASRSSSRRPTTRRIAVRRSRSGGWACRRDCRSFPTCAARSACPSSRTSTPRRRDRRGRCSGGHPADAGLPLPSDRFHPGRRRAGRPVNIKKGQFLSRGR
jgi:hypothetical protein